MPGRDPKDRALLVVAWFSGAVDLIATLQTGSAGIKRRAGGCTESHA